MGMQVPNGFAITAEGYRFFLQEAQLDQTMRVLLHDLKTHDLARLRHRGRQVCQPIPAVSLPLAQAIIAAADRLSAESAHKVDVAVRSSATLEDLPDARFAGQQETYLMGQHHD